MLVKEGEVARRRSEKWANSTECEEEFRAGPADGMLHGDCRKRRI